MAHYAPLWRGFFLALPRRLRLAFHSLPHEVRASHVCKMGLEGIVSKRLGSRYRSGRWPDWLKFKVREAPAVKREEEEDWWN